MNHDCVPHFFQFIIYYHSFSQHYRKCRHINNTHKARPKFLTTVFLKTPVFGL